MVNLRSMRTVKGIANVPVAPPQMHLAAASRSASSAETSNNPMVGLGQYLLMAYTFLAFSRVLDLFPSGLRLPLVFFILMSLAALLSGRLLECLHWPIGRWMFGLSLWF